MTIATTYRPARVPILVAALAIASAFTLGAVGGRATITAASTPGAVSQQAAAPSTPAGRLEALGFAPAQANHLIHDLDTSVGFGHRFAAERIAVATEFGSAHIYGNSVREAPVPRPAR